MKKEREIQLDVIKVIASLMVIVLHLGNIYLRAKYFGEKPVYQWIGHFCSITMRLCVPLFVMVSGYLFFGKKKKLNLIGYYKNTIARIIVPTIIASIFYTVLTGGQQFVFSDRIRFDVLLENLYTGNVYSHLWYMYMAIGLYLVAPIFHTIYCNIDKQMFFFLGIGLTGIGVVSAFLFDLPWPFLFIQYLGYFVMGKAIRDIDLAIPKKHLLLIGVGIWTIVYGFSVWQRIYHFHENIQLYKYLSPFTIVCAWIFYYVISRYDFKQMNVNLRNHIAALSSANLWIYLVHQFYLDVLFHWILRDNSVWLNPIIFIPIISVAVYYISFYSTKPLQLKNRSKRG